MCVHAAATQNATKHQGRARAQTWTTCTFRCRRHATNNAPANGQLLSRRSRKRTHSERCRACTFFCATVMENEAVAFMRPDEGQQPAAGGNNDIPAAVNNNDNVQAAVPVLPPRRHNCPECPASFARVFTLRQHIRTTHQAVQPLHACTLCGILFTTGNHLRQHHLQRHQPTGNGTRARTQTTARVNP